MLRKTDIFIIYFFIAVILFFIFIPFFSTDRPKFVVIEKDGKVIRKESLEKDRIVKIEGENTFWILEIKNRKIRAIKSSCPKRYCIEQGWVDRANYPIVCAPQKLIAVLRGGKSRIDAVTR
ncbi:MAG: NusG domain II-containing protein [Elusimicrobiota bacterium]